MNYKEILLNLIGIRKKMTHTSNVQVILIRGIL